MNNPKPQEWRAEELSQGYIADYKPLNFVDGEGVRNSLYVSGCPFHCEGCYNEATWNFRFGVPYSPELEERIMVMARVPVISSRRWTCLLTRLQLILEIMSTAIFMGLPKLVVVQVRPMSMKFQLFPIRKPYF